MLVQVGHFRQEKMIVPGLSAMGEAITLEKTGTGARIPETGNGPSTILNCPITGIIDIPPH